MYLFAFYPKDSKSDLLEFRSFSKFNKKEVRHLKFAKVVLILSKLSQKHEIRRYLDFYCIIPNVLGKLRKELKCLVKVTK